MTSCLTPAPPCPPTLSRCPTTSCLKDGRSECPGQTVRITPNCICFSTTTRKTTTLGSFLCFDHFTGKEYYLNLHTKQSQWEVPTEPAQPDYEPKVSTPIQRYRHCVGSLTRRRKNTPHNKEIQSLNQGQIRLNVPVFHNND